MRIALFTETFIPKVDGIVTTLCQTIRQLESLGHRVLVFAPDGGFDHFLDSRIVPMKGHSFIFYPELRLSLPRSSIRTALEEFKPDLIHAADPALLGIAALYYGGGKHGGAVHVPLVVSYHTDLPKYLNYYGMGFAERWIWPLLRKRHNRATVNLCTSVAMIEQLEQHGIERLALWPGGVDAERFQPSKRTDAMRARLTGGHPEAPLLLYVGRLSAEKGIERLRPILQAFPSARLALVGDGPHHKALAHHFAGLPVYWAGFLLGDELAQAFASADVFLMPSRTETLGLVILEAMASGLPVVGARAGGIPELIEPRVSGFLFDDESEAIAALHELLHSPQLRRTVGAAARTRAVQQGWKTATAQLLEQYHVACRNQAIACERVPDTSPRTVGSRLSQACGQAALFTARKLLR
jgi:glycosyltransferase involved in cell wall biosynthesis